MRHCATKKTRLQATSHEKDLRVRPVTAISGLTGKAAQVQKRRSTVKPVVRGLNVVP
jgi:hypothetical protein